MFNFMKRRKELKCDPAEIWRLYLDFFLVWYHLGYYISDMSGSNLQTISLGQGQGIRSLNE